MAILVFLEVLETQMSFIDYLFGLYININVNDGQNKFLVHILKNVPKLANLRF